jgi:hypothetical protein
LLMCLFEVFFGDRDDVNSGEPLACLAWRQPC